MIRSYCSECEAEMVDGTMKHKSNCSALKFQPVVVIPSTPPGTTIKFDTKEEQDNFMRNLNSTQIGER